ncbi:MAG: GNAT family N-acetyltransferase [Lachnospiraceae bacterium]
MRKMMLKRAENKDTSKIENYYRYVIDHTENMDKYCRWIYGLHPSDEMIEEYITNESMYFAEEDGEIIAAVAVTFFQDEDYHPVPWNVVAKDDEVAAIHILCTHPKKQRSGLAKRIVKEIIEMARAKQRKAVRLDAICCNAPAHRLYEDLGFKKCGIQNWYASNLGYIDFYLYEFVLE